jgi:hypothetical protein
LFWREEKRGDSNEFVCTAVVFGTGLLAQTNASFATGSVESNENWTNVKLNWTNVNFVLVEGVGFDGQTCFLGHGSEMFTSMGKHFVFVAEEKRKRGRGKGEN